MKKKEAATLLGSIALIACVALLIKYKKGFWWWILALFLIIPAFARIGWALGKEDPQAAAIDEQERMLGMKREEEERLRKQRCADRGGNYFGGRCTKPFSMEVIDVSKYTG